MYDESLERQLSNWLHSLQRTGEYLIVKETDLSPLYAMLPGKSKISMAEVLPRLLDAEKSKITTRAKYKIRFWKINKISLLVGISILITACASPHKLPANCSLESLFEWLTDMLGMNALALTALFLSLSEEQYLRLDEIEEILHQNLPIFGITEKRLINLVMLNYPNISSDQLKHALQRLIDEKFLNIKINKQGQKLVSLNLRWIPL